MTNGSWQMRRRKLSTLAEAVKPTFHAIDAKEKRRRDCSVEFVLISSARAEREASPQQLGSGQARSRR